MCCVCSGGVVSILRRACASNKHCGHNTNRSEHETCGRSQLVGAVAGGSWTLAVFQHLRTESGVFKTRCLDSQCPVVLGIFRKDLFVAAAMLGPAGSPGPHLIAVQVNDFLIEVLVQSLSSSCRGHGLCATAGAVPWRPTLRDPPRPENDASLRQRRS